MPSHHSHHPLLCVLALLLFGAAGLSTAASVPGPDFVRVVNGHFLVNGSATTFAGTNNLYVQLADRWEVDDTVSRAVLANFSLLRIWAFSDNAFCPPPNQPPQQPYFQCWDNATASIWTNESALSAHLDYAVASAARAGLYVILCLVNNWSAYGGIPAYLQWRMAYAATQNESYVGHHDDFYTDSVIRGWYQSWAERLVARVNTVSGIAYADDPAIDAWELGNELSCGGDDHAFNTSSGCVVDGGNPSIIAWVKAMAGLIHGIDANHLVTIGDEGFYGTNRGSVPCPRDQWWCNGQSGDWLSQIALPEVDFGTLHMYPDSMYMSEWSLDNGDEDAVARGWLENHTAQAAAFGKPMIMEGAHRFCPARRSVCCNHARSDPAQNSGTTMRRPSTWSTGDNCHGDARLV